MVVLYFLVLVYFISITSTSGCVIAQEGCPNINIKFYLVNTLTLMTNDSYELFQNNITNIKEAPYKKDDNGNVILIVIVHGLGGSGTLNSTPAVNLVPKYLQYQPNANIILVDWKNLACSIFQYPIAVTNVKAVGICLAGLLNFLVANLITIWELIHLIGFSLGAHVAGWSSEYTNGKVSRITGLDPAGPGFTIATLPSVLGLPSISIGLHRSLKSTDGICVICYHSSNFLGTSAANCQVDVFINGGVSQPGCSSLAPLTDNQTSFYCNHVRSVLVYSETIANNAILGYPCVNLPILGCNPSLFGDTTLTVVGDECVGTGKTGTFYAPTNAAPPYLPVS